VTYTLEWAKTPHGEWFYLESAPLDTIHGWGVYVIWMANGKPMRPGTVLKVGSGNIGTRLFIERLSPDYSAVDRSRLLVTWALVADHHQANSGIVRFLSEALHPFFLDLDQNAVPVPIPVNLPLTA
jgi:hypothetical protein